MSERRIVPDNSVLIAAFFRETLIVGGQPVDLSARARPVADAIRLGRVKAFAPDALHVEFLKVAYRKARPQGQPAELSDDELTARYFSFLALRITPVPAPELVAVAFDLSVRGGIGTADSWYVACAMFAGADLWVSHEHADGLIASARRFHRGVFTLVTDRFR